MCEGVTNLETVERSLGHGLDLIMRLDRTCAEHDGVVVGYGAIFHGPELVQVFEPVQFSDDEDGRVRFYDAVSLVEADASMQISLAEMMGIIPPT